tara:strand:- start:806 stop:1537 length:732 start_codon:yes stop_codon:yes gene_type:complete
MATLKLNDVTTMTESGGTVTMADGVALGTPASGVVTNLSGALPVGVTGGSGLNAVPASTGASMVHILTASVGTGANTGSTFMNFWDSAYKTYYIIIRDIQNGASGGQELRITFATGGTHTADLVTGEYYEVAGSGYKSSGDVYNTSQESSSSIKICPNLGHQDWRQYNAQFIMTGMKDEDAFTSITGYCGWYHGGNYLVGSSMSGHYSQDLGGGSPSVTGFEFKIGSGTFEGGSISIYGLKES